MFLNGVFQQELFNRLLAGFLASFIKMVEFLENVIYFLVGIKTYEISACRCWSNLTLKCQVNTLMKVDSQREKECRRAISYLKGHSHLKLNCKKLIMSNQKPTATAL